MLKFSTFCKVLFSFIIFFLLSLLIWNLNIVYSFSIWMALTSTLKLAVVSKMFIFNSLFSFFLVVVWVSGILSVYYAFSNLKNTRRFTLFSILMIFFMLSMSVLVLSNSFIILFLGWEAIGLTSYFLIGFWSNRTVGRVASTKAVAINRIGDICLLLACVYLIFILNIPGFSLLSTLTIMDHTTPAVQILILLAAVFKSAQYPATAWLVSAMEGPTPVSALLHAATLVTAGCILLIKFISILGSISYFIFFIAVVTAVYCSIRATIEYDFKTVVALSTAAQMSIVFLFISLDKVTLAVLYLSVHAVFKALLFWAVGVYNHDFKTQYILKSKATNRVVFFALLLSTLTLLGLPFFSAFYFKELLVTLPAGIGLFSTIAVLFIVVLELQSAVYAARVLLKVTKINTGKSCTNLNSLIPFLLYSIASFLIGRFVNPVTFNYITTQPALLQSVPNTNTINPLINFIFFLIILFIFLIYIEFILLTLERIFICLLMLPIIFLFFLLILVGSILYMWTEIIKFLVGAVLSQILDIFLFIVTVLFVAVFFLKNIFYGILIALSLPVLEIVELVSVLLIFVRIIFGLIYARLLVVRQKFLNIWSGGWMFAEDEEPFLWSILAIYFASISGFLLQFVAFKIGRLLIYYTYIVLVTYGLFVGENRDNKNVHLWFFLIPIIIFIITYSFTAGLYVEPISFLFAACFTG